MTKIEFNKTVLNKTQTLNIREKDFESTALNMLK